MTTLSSADAGAAPIAAATHAARIPAETRLTSNPSPSVDGDQANAAGGCGRPAATAPAALRNASGRRVGPA